VLRILGRLYADVHDPRAILMYERFVQNAERVLDPKPHVPSGTALCSSERSRR